MNENRINLAEQVNKFNNGDFDSYDVATQCDAGWYDWFCKKSSLHNKTKVLYGKVKSILKNDSFNRIKPNTSYVFFKNNCPAASGVGLYDSFSICDIKTGDVLYYITPKSSWTNKAELYGGPNKQFSEPLACGSWKNILDYFRNE